MEDIDMLDKKEINGKYEEFKDRTEYKGQIYQRNV